MDVLKLLSRSTKRKRRHEEQGKIEVNAPRANSGSAQGLPTRRQSQVDVDKGKRDVNNVGRPKSVKKRKKLADRETNPSDALQFDQASTSSLGVEDCKRILREHKLKLVKTWALNLRSSLTEEDNHAESVPWKKRKRGLQGPGFLDSIPEGTNLYPQPLQHFSQLQTVYDISPVLLRNLEQQHYRVPTEVQAGSLPILLDASKSLQLAQQSNNREVNGKNLDQFREPLHRFQTHLLCVAPTGSGKTLAFLIPTISAILEQRKNEENDNGKKKVLARRPIAIILAPTKELAGQITNEARKLTAGTGIKASLFRKGMNLPSEEEDDETEFAGIDSENTSQTDSEASETEGKKVDQPPVNSSILVATPLSLLNALRSRRTSSADHTPRNLASVRYLILDEADILLDPLFHDQTVGVWSACSSPALRVSLWSATISSSIEATTRNIIASHSQGDYASESESPATAMIRLVVGLKDTAIPSNISHHLVYGATEQGKLLGLRQMLHPAGNSSSNGQQGMSDTPQVRPPFLVFTQTIARAIALHAELRYDIPLSAGGGDNRIAVLHADLSSTARERVMSRFRAGEIWMLITTDLLSRGVDFHGVNAVINYDFPNSSAQYIHRVGRAGRAMVGPASYSDGSTSVQRRPATAVTLYTQEDVPFLKNVANVIRMSGQDNSNASQSTHHSSSNKQISYPGLDNSQAWILESLPNASKKSKRELKRRGIESRRPNASKPQSGHSVTSGRDMKTARSSRLDKESAFAQNGDDAAEETGSMEASSTSIPTSSMSKEHKVRKQAREVQFMRTGKHGGDRNSSLNTTISTKTAWDRRRDRAKREGRRKFRKIA